MRLSADDHAAITGAWLSRGTWRDAATLLGQSTVASESAAIRGFWRTLAERDGWWQPIWVRPCLVCGELITARSPGQQTHRKRCHSRAVNGRRQQRGYKSTPWVNRWRAANPGRDLALRIQERFREPRSSTAPSNERRVAHSRAAISSRQRIDDELRQTADNHGAIWSADDDRWLIEHQDWSASAAAEVLGRTASSVLNRRGLLRKRGLVPPRGREPVEVGQPYS